MLFTRESSSLLKETALDLPKSRANMTKSFLTVIDITCEIAVNSTRERFFANIVFEDPPEGSGAHKSLGIC